jgi:hypothetical protein
MHKMGARLRWRGAETVRELEQLRELLERASMSVRVRTPPPQLVFSAQETGRRHAWPQHHWNRTTELAT